MAIVLSAACASSSSRSDAPDVKVQLTPAYQSSDFFYFAGPINLQYQLSIANPSGETLTLRRLELRSEGSGAYVLRTAATPMNVTVPPRSTKTVPISVWGRSMGGFLRSNEPVTLRTTAYFDSPKGSFVKMNTEMIRPE